MITGYRYVSKNGYSTNWHKLWYVDQYIWDRFNKKFVDEKGNRIKTRIYTHTEYSLLVNKTPPVMKPKKNDDLYSVISRMNNDHAIYDKLVDEFCQKIRRHDA